MTERKGHRILLVDDDPSALQALIGLFEEDYLILSAASGDEAIKMVSDHSDLATVVMDIRMPGTDGILAAREIRRVRPELPVIFHTGFPGFYDEDGVDTAERPFDYIQKGGPISRLTRSVRNAVETYRTGRDLKRLALDPESAYGMIGSSPPMLEVYKLIQKVSLSDGKVMVFGETGTGKELVARAIHRTSPRRGQRLAIFNCNHKAVDLVEAELFGHARGSFTGAVEDRTGLFEYANGGTVFLDEIGDLDITTQAKLLRVLESGEYHRIGDPDIRTTNVRVVCATHKDLQQLVENQTFREDLYYRLRGVQIHLPPLRDRVGDIPFLIDRFKDRYTIERDLPPKHFDESAMNLLAEYHWPGNVRQLLESIETLIILTDSDIVLAEDVQRHLGIAEAKGKGEITSERLTDRVRAYRRKLIAEALLECDNNVSAAARLLGVDRANLRKMILDHHISLK